MRIKENQIQRELCAYLKIQYPNVRFKSDMSGEYIGGSGAKNHFQTVRIANQRSHKGFPDLQIYERQGKFCGLALELKADHASPYKKDGTLKKEYTEQGKRHDQVLWLKHLAKIGWSADFAVGFNEAKIRIDNYLINE